jgi:hypothetical protein
MRRPPLGAVFEPALDGFLESDVTARLLELDPLEHVIRPGEGLFVVRLNDLARFPHRTSRPSTNYKLQPFTLQHERDLASIAPEVQALRDKCEELADDVRALATLVHALRTAHVAVGVVKGGVG